MTTSSTPTPSLPELRAQLDSVLAAYPALRRGGRQLIADIDRQLGQATAPTSSQRRNRERYTGGSSPAETR